MLTESELQRLTLSLGLVLRNDDESSNELMRGRVRIIDGGLSAEASARIDELQIPDRDGS
jgi:hypothetical protein